MRVPVFYGHAEAVNIETREKITAARCARCSEQAPGVEVVDEREAGGLSDPGDARLGQATRCIVGRIREDKSHPRAVNLWIVVGQHPQGRRAQRGADRRAGDAEGWSPHEG